MVEYIRKEATVDAGYLSDWYISSVGDEPPVWTDAHIDELLNDFIVIPKDTPTADVQPVKHGRWINIYEYCEERDLRPTGLGVYYWCSECGEAEKKTSDFCPNCGARMEQEG